MLKDAGTYTINVSVSGQSYTVGGCTIIINQAEPKNVTVKQIAGTTLTSNSTEITSGAKNYFAVYDGNTQLEDGEVDITATYESTTDSYKVTATGKNKNYSTFTITNTFNPYSAKFQFNLEWYAAQKYSILYIMMQITNLTKHCIISDKCETIINLD